MRNEALVGYLLHQRPYQEKRALYYLFSQQHGVVHGVGKKGAPLFTPLQLFATGKRDLKTFSQINIASAEQQDLTIPSSPNKQAIKKSISYEQISGQQQYAALYLNEILWRLLPTDDPMPELWQHYQHTLNQLKQPLTADELRLNLRRFEQYLFTELGFELSLTQDSMETPIEVDTRYRFLPDVGLVPIAHAEQSLEASARTVFEGSDILKMAQQSISIDTLDEWSRLYRQLIDHLLDYQPLQSRLLWQQQQRYQ